MDQNGWCPMFLCSQAWISILPLPEPKANRKTTLKVKCFREASLKGAKGALSVGAEKTGKGSKRGWPLVLRVRLYGTIQETSEIPSLLTLMGEFSFVSQGSSKAINGARLNFLSCNNYRRKSAMPSKGSALKSHCFLRHRL